MNAMKSAADENQSRIRAVVLDWAGTTIDFGSRAPTSVFMEIFRRQEVPITAAEAREPMGQAKRAHIEAILRMPRVAELWTERRGAAPNEGDVDRLYAEFLPLQMETLSRHADLIPGTLEAAAELKKRGVRIGSTTGYTRDLMNVVWPLSAQQGYEPDHVITADDVSHGRPAPWMLFRSAERLGVYPMRCIAAIDDTPVGIEAGRSAGCWTVAVVQSGNAMGLSPDELAALDSAELQSRVDRVTEIFRAAGADYVIPSVAELMPTIDAIDARLAAGESPPG